MGGVRGGYRSGVVEVSMCFHDFVLDFLCDRFVWLSAWLFNCLLVLCACLSLLSCACVSLSVCLTFGCVCLYFSCLSVCLSVCLLIKTKNSRKVELLVLQEVM